MRTPEMRNPRAASMLAAAIVILAGFACSPQVEREVEEEVEQEVEPATDRDVPRRVEATTLPGDSPRERCEAFYTEGLAVDGDTRVDLESALGDPVAVEQATEPNRHDPARVDTLWVLRYEGLEAEIRTAGGRDLLERMTVADDRHLRFREPAPGTTEEELIEIFGEPDRRRGSYPEYLCAPEPTPDMPVTFEMDGDRVARIVWEYYVD